MCTVGSELARLRDDPFLQGRAQQDLLFILLEKCRHDAGVLAQVRQHQEILLQLEEKGRILVGSLLQLVCIWALLDVTHRSPAWDAFIRRGVTATLATKQQQALPLLLDVCTVLLTIDAARFGALVHENVGMSLLGRKGAVTPLHPSFLEAWFRTLPRELPADIFSSLLQVLCSSTNLQKNDKKKKREPAAWWLLHRLFSEHQQRQQQQRHAKVSLPVTCLALMLHATLVPDLVGSRDASSFERLLIHHFVSTTHVMDCLALCRAPHSLYVADNNCPDWTCPHLTVSRNGEEEKEQEGAVLVMVMREPPRTLFLQLVHKFLLFHSHSDIKAHRLAQQLCASLLSETPMTAQAKRILFEYYTMDRGILQFKDLYMQCPSIEARTLAQQVVEAVWLRVWHSTTLFHALPPKPRPPPDTASVSALLSPRRRATPRSPRPPTSPRPRTAAPKTTNRVFSTAYSSFKTHPGTAAIVQQILADLQELAQRFPGDATFLDAQRRKWQRKAHVTIGSKFD